MKKGSVIMETLIASIHVLVALILIFLVLIQDSKGGGMGGAFGGGSSSVFGATGAATLAQKLTRWTAVIFAVTSIWLTVLSSQSGKSLLETTAVPAAATPAADATTAPATDAAASTTTTVPVSQ